MNWFAVAYATEQRDHQVPVPPLVAPIHPEQMRRLPQNVVRAIEEAEAIAAERRAAFTCPYCRGPAWRAPVRNYTLAVVVAAVRPEADAEGAQMREENEMMLHMFFNADPDL